MEQTAAFYLGDRLGRYGLLATTDRRRCPSSPPALAPSPATPEWLEYQAVCGLLIVDDPAAPGVAGATVGRRRGTRRYAKKQGGGRELIPGCMTPIAGC
jgi:hypothetical protein